MKWLTLNIFKSGRNSNKKTSKRSDRYPNSWGRMRFDGQLREMMPDKELDVKNGLRRHDFLRRFVIDRVDGIACKNGYHAEDQRYERID